MNNGAGRPQKEIDWKLVDKLLGIQCAMKEISGVIGVSHDTILRRCQDEHGIDFASYSEEKSQSGRMSLRRKQFDVALGGNVTMLIWLGKQYLGQKDKTETMLDTVKPITLAYNFGDDKVEAQIDA